jgi:uncharacterized repeat protein (TIGR04076 family)
VLETGNLSKIPCDEEKLKDIEEYKVKIKVNLETVMSPYVHPASPYGPQDHGCAAGYHPGDEMEVVGPVLTKGRMCVWAYPLLHPVIMNKRFGLRTPFEQSETVRICCPDWATNVVFEISRGEKMRRSEIIKEAQAALRQSNDEKSVHHEEETRANGRPLADEYGKAAPTVGHVAPMEEWKTRVRVVDKKGYCAAGHQLGDEVEVSGLLVTKGNICLWALNRLCNTLQLKRFGLRGAFEQTDTHLKPCPDWENPVYFETTLKKKVSRIRNLVDCVTELEKWRTK